MRSQLWSSRSSKPRLLPKEAGDIGGHFVLLRGFLERSSKYQTIIQFLRALFVVATFGACEQPMFEDFSGVPWGSDSARIARDFGEPDEVFHSGLLELAYDGQRVGGQEGARIFVLDRGEGLIAGGYMFELRRSCDSHRTFITLYSQMFHLYGKPDSIDGKDIPPPETTCQHRSKYNSAVWRKDNYRAELTLLDRLVDLMYITPKMKRWEDNRVKRDF